MANARPPSPDELPSSKELLRSTAIAALVAAAVLVTVILPAEYGIDPTGLGGISGLKRMGEVKGALAQETVQAGVRAHAVPPPAAPAPEAPAPVAPAPAAAPPAAAESPAPAAGRNDEVSVTLRPNQAAEVKLVMRKGARATFRWSVKGGHVNFDTHGDPMDNPDGYHGYEKGRQSVGDEGVLEAAFDGRHGWYWRNRSGADVTITLRTEGDYQDIQRVL